MLTTYPEITSAVRRRGSAGRKEGVEDGGEGASGGGLGDCWLVVESCLWVSCLSVCKCVGASTGWTRERLTAVCEPQ